MFLFFKAMKADVEHFVERILKKKAQRDVSLGFVLTRGQLGKCGLFTHSIIANHQVAIVRNVVVKQGTQTFNIITPVAV